MYCECAPSLVFLGLARAAVEFCRATVVEHKLSEYSGSDTETERELLKIFKQRPEKMVEVAILNEVKRCQVCLPFAHK